MHTKLVLLASILTISHLQSMKRALEGDITPDNAQENQIETPSLSQDMWSEIIQQLNSSTIQKHIQTLAQLRAVNKELHTFLSSDKIATILKTSTYSSQRRFETRQQLNKSLFKVLIDERFFWLQTLYLAGANIHTRSSTKYNYNIPLLQAAFYGQPTCLNFLLQKGADIDAKNNFEETALHAAINSRYGNTLCIELLIAADANPSAKDNRFDKSTPLHKAVEYDRVEWVEKLIAAGADVDATDKDDYTPLFKATNPTCKQALIQAGATLQIPIRKFDHFIWQHYMNMSKNPYQPYILLSMDPDTLSISRTYNGI